jgi:hypothetical protein
MARKASNARSTVGFFASMYVSLSLSVPLIRYTRYSAVFKRGFGHFSIRYSAHL